MTAPPPYAGEQCRNADDGGEHDQDITRAGSYYGLCGVCRPLEGARRAERRAAGRTPASLEDRDLDGLRDEVVARAQRGPRLRKAIEALAEAGDRLEEAVEQRDAASMHAQVVVSEFKEALQQVGRTAQSLLNGRNGNGP